MADDLRDWLVKVDKLGDLERIEGAKWDTEIGCLTSMNWRRQPSPALLFNKIPGYPPEFRVVTGSTRTPGRVALTFNLPQGLKGLPLMDAVRQKINEWESVLEKYPPVMVDSGPVLENVLSGDDIDLFKFPVPKWHEEDGGRFIGTGDAVITRDPETGVVNVGTYRVQVHDKKTPGIYISPGRHGFLHVQKNHLEGKACPVLVSVGHHPLVFRIACLEVPFGMEYQYMGAVRGEPMKLLKEEVTGLPFPADSEIVIAGFIPPDKKHAEGPFGEWHGYYASGERPAPIIEVQRIYHRHNPIIMGSPPGRPPSDSSYYMVLMSGAMIHNELLKAGIPDIRGVGFSEVGLQQFITISIKQRYAGHAKLAALIVSQLRRASYMNRYVVVVDEDIDPTDIQDVIWAISTRSNPETDIDIIRRTRSSAVDPQIRKPATAFFNSRAIIDACKPYEWIEEFPKVIDFKSDLVSDLRKKYTTFAGD
ncbi:MAG: UbiD family decarboxylase [Dehalococcoidia bacterium]|nr:UbiD family decarboxylase [Dehalococcoidia bacterium]